jgi:hypothetical protein
VEIHDEGGNNVERRTIGRTPEGKVEIVTSLGKFFGFLLTLVTVFLLLVNKIVGDANDRLKLELQTIFVTKADSVSKVEYDLRHEDLRRSIAQLEKHEEANRERIEQSEKRLDQVMYGNGVKR